MLKLAKRQSLVVALGISIFGVQAYAQEICPDGYSYLYHQGGRNFCFADTETQCNDVQFRCGVGGTSCCPIGQNNVCASGFNACKPAGSDVIFGNSLPLCCLKAPEPITAPVPTPPPALKTIMSGVTLFCQSGMGTGSSQFFGWSSVSCDEAYSIAVGDADSVGCARLGNNYSEQRRERIETGTCRLP